MILIRTLIILLSFIPVFAISQGLIIGNNANITINPGIGMSINNANCTIKSDTNGTGSLVDKSITGNISISGSAVSERFIPRGNSTAFGTGLWHYVSSPVTNQPIDMAFLTSNDVSVIDGRYDFYLWEEANNIWRKYGGPTFNDTEFVPGKGYAIIFDSDGSRVFTGTSGSKFNTGDITIVLSKASATNFEGFNLIGNPYPSPISNSDFVTSNSSSIEGTMYFWSQKPNWENREDNYSYWNLAGTVGNGYQDPDDYTAVGQAFMVSALIDNQNVIFTNSMRSAGDPVYLKDQLSIPRIWLSITNDNQNYNETLIAFPPDATKGFDKAYDARKMKGGGLILCTKCVEDEYLDLAIQGLSPLTDKHEIVCLPMETQAVGNHDLYIKKIENWDQDISIILEDRISGRFYDLGKKEHYSFTTLAPGNYHDRFLLHFNSPINIEDNLANADVLIYSYGDAIYIKSDIGGTISGELQVYNLLGQMIYNESIKQYNIGKYTPYCKPGYYVVKLIVSEFVVSKKIYIR